jgi:glucan phosphoethanolaminetransferase (alkaline phosphatase superfamily)
MEMKHSNDNAMTIATIGFAVFASIVIIAAMVFLAAIVNQSPTVTDTYGNTINAQSNTSQNLVTTISSEEEYSMVPLMLLIVAVFVCVVIFAAWVASKTGISV